MSTNVHDADESDGTNRGTDKRWTDWALLGIDEENAHHVINLPTRRVFVIDGTDVVRVEDLAAKDAAIEDWLAHVERKRGWAERGYGRSLVDILAASPEEGW